MLPPQPAQLCLLVVFLMINFGSEEGRCRLEQEFAFLLVKAHLGKHFTSFALLLLTLIENSRSVLACFLSLIPARLEQLQVMPYQILKGHNFGVEQYLHSLSMPRAPSADISVGRILRTPARVAGSCVLDPVNSLKRRLNTPESTSCKNCLVKAALLWKFGNRSISKHYRTQQDNSENYQK